MVDLRILLIEITKKCNARCDQCGSRCDDSGEELLTKEDIIHTLEDIKENLGTDAMINISGGEPLMRRDLFDIMSEVSRMGFDWGMVTNGTLITDQVIRNMKESGMKTITISLDGMEKTHEELRHLPGSFRRIIKSIIKLKREQFLDCLQVTFTANSRNVYEIADLYSLLERIGIDSIRVSFIDPIGRAEDNRELLLDKEQMQWLFHTGAKHPMSMFEQQMGLVGFKVDDNYVIRYVFPSCINRLAADLAIFNRHTLKQAEKETNIIKRNVKISDDKKKPITGELRFLGFIHSHPIQKELQYSIGDEKIHKKLVEKYGDYVGMLINPGEDVIGAYYGKNIRQANLKLLA